MLFIGELLIIVEYCQFGNLQSYLIKNRNSFINQVDEFGNLTTDTIIADESDNGITIQQVAESPETSFSCVSNSNEYVGPYSSKDELHQSNSTIQIDARQQISTKNLISWSFQITRGMGYLASKKVLQYRLSELNNN